MTSIFEKLICSDCKQYLSVFPIKVYHNFSVKCGRCSLDDDGGTVSKLYETIAEKLEFPCINHYEGCKKLLKPEEVPLHEMTCKGTPIKCPVCFYSTEDPLEMAEDCFDVKGHSLKMIEHFKQKHNENFLRFPEFAISLNDKNEEKMYLYASDLKNVLGIIWMRYDQIVNKLYLDIAPIYIEAGHARRFTQKFKLYSTNNILIYKSTVNNCKRYSEMNLYYGFSGISMEEKFDNNIVICKFFINEDEHIGFKSDLPESESSLSMVEPKTIIKEVIKEVYVNNQSNFTLESLEMCNISHHRDVMEFDVENFGTHVIRCFFDNIQCLGEAGQLSSIFYRANTSWKMFIKKYIQKNTPYLSIFLVKEKNENENRYSFKVDAVVEILAYNHNFNRKKSFEGRVFGARQGESYEWGWLTFMPWNELIDENKTYAGRNEDNIYDIEIQLNMTLLKIFKHKNFCKCNSCL